MGFSRQECWNGLPLPSPVDQILSELSTMTRLSWVALHDMAHSFNELHKAVIHVRLAFCDCGFHSGGHRLKFLFLLSILWWRKVRGLCKLPDGRDYLWGKLVLALVGRATLPESLIQFSAGGWGCAPSLLFGRRWPSPGACSLYDGATGSMVRLTATSSMHSASQDCCC